MADDVPKSSNIPVARRPPTELSNMAALVHLAEICSVNRAKVATLTTQEMSVTIERNSLEMKLLTMTNCLVHNIFAGEDRINAFRSEFQQYMDQMLFTKVTFFKTDLFDPELVQKFLKDFGITSVKKVELAGHFGAASVNDFLAAIKTEELVLDPEVEGKNAKFDWATLKPINIPVKTSKLALYIDLDLEKFDNISLHNTSFKSTEINNLIRRWKKKEFPNFKSLSIVNNKSALVTSAILRNIIHQELVWENTRLVHCTIVDAEINGRIANLYLNRNSFSFDVTDEVDFYPEGYVA